MRIRTAAAALALALHGAPAFAQNGDDPIGALIGAEPAAPSASQLPLLPGPTDAVPDASDAGGAPPVGRDGLEIAVEPEPGVEPFLPPPVVVDPLAELPDAATVDYAFGAFQRGLYLTALAVATPLAERGDAAAQTLIGYLYANGLGVPQKPDEAVVWYRLAVSNGNAGAMVELANLAALGLGLPRDVKLARDLLESALKAGRIEAAYGLGLLYLDPESGITDHAAAAGAFEAAAQAGNVDAQYALASMVAAGRGVPQDDARAAKLMGDAARGGHVGAQVEYAIMVFNGKGVAKDEAAAASWFDLAAQAGNPVAQNRLARLYASGRGVAADLSRAAFWHFRARRAGLSDLWLDGIVETMPAEARAAAAEKARAP